MEPEVRVVLLTAPDEEVAASLARVLVEERLAACVNLLPGVRSLYRWEGRVHDEGEVLLLAKSRSDRLSALTERVRTLHPYDEPEVLALPAVGGSESYLGWVLREAARPQETTT